jgi:hypothetical protein
MVVEVALFVRPETVLMARPSHSGRGMSKQNPNQDFYKIGGRAQSDGPDRMHGDANQDKQQMGEIQATNDKNAKHPAVLRAKKK